ncbi:MAG TPA: nucleoside deaminase [Cytophagales bacterium]|nr:nucleoside deaminase [Cytophagales bacterium]
MEDTHVYYLKRAVALSRYGMENNYGGPFGCIIVKDGIVVGEGFNRVTSSNDPTAHAEIVAIRDACSTLGTFQLEGCILYTSCEPCPMCMGAIYWARPLQVIYANTRVDAAAIGFDDKLIYDEIKVEELSNRRIPFIHVNIPEAKEVFAGWANKNKKIDY